MTVHAGPEPTQREAVLARNLQALTRSSRAAVQRVLDAAPRHDVTFLPTDDGVPGATLGLGPVARQLCSRRRPLDEARTFAESVNLAEVGAAVVLGFGCGWHVRELARRFERSGVVLVFEPDVALLRAVLETIDHSAWLETCNVAILTDPQDQGAISAAISGVEVVLAIGTKFFEHAPSKERLGTSADTFGSTFASVVRAARTNVVTTLMKVDTTLQNHLGNLRVYALAPGIVDLKDAAKGRTAVVVSAGPSLHRNMAELAKPGVRDRVVIIAVQTVLKTLLRAGIKPHFVTALDHAAISTRFYEGLTREDVEGVTLVVEPKAHPAIAAAYPGQIRCPAEPILDRILGPHAREMGPITPGATVAHLAYYLARHLGCDPVVLIGQDLGFTDGQYYAAGAAIHQVWSGELSEFNTLEMLEWQRIVRHRRLLHRATDHLGRPVYTDEQMSTYLVQFERDFARDAVAGLTTIDATEGGVAKRHTHIRTLREALESALSQEPLALPTPSPTPTPTLALTPTSAAIGTEQNRLEAIEDRLRQIRRDTWQVGEMARRTGELLDEMHEHHADQIRVDRLITKVREIAARVATLQPAESLVQHLNQTGMFNRFKADRLIEVGTSLSPMERQKLQIERDRTNVRWLAESADALGEMFDGVLADLRRTPTTPTTPTSSTRGDPAAARRTAEPARATPSQQRDAVKLGSNKIKSPAATRTGRRSEVVACMPVDLLRGSLGMSRDLAVPLWQGKSALHLTLSRLAASRSLGAAVLITHEAEKVRALLGFSGNSGEVDGLPVRLFGTVRPAMRARAAGVRGARLWTPACWRGGLGNLTCWDEVFPPQTVARVLEQEGARFAALVGADWVLCDGAMLDRQIELCLRAEDPQRITFSQAAVGLSPAVMELGLVRELADNAASSGPLASLGALLGYIPIAPQSDPIARESCVPVPSAARDLSLRCIADRPYEAALLAAALEELSARHGMAWVTAPLEEIAAVLTAKASETMPPAPTLIEIEPTTRRCEGTRRVWDEPITDAELDTARMVEWLAASGTSLSASAVTLAGRGDPLESGELPAFIQSLRSRLNIAGVHVRTDLPRGNDADAARVLEQCDVMSVDLLAETGSTHELLSGGWWFENASEGVVAMLEQRQAASPPSEGLCDRWIIPRLTRCDEVYGEIEAFYDRWIMKAGWAVLDPRPEGGTGRIAALPRPVSVLERDRRSRLIVRADGSVLSATGRRVGSITDAPLPELWKRCAS